MQNRLIATLGIAQSEYMTVKSSLNREKKLKFSDVYWSNLLYADTVQGVAEAVPFELVLSIGEALKDE